MLSLGEWIEAGAWLQLGSKTHNSRLNMPLADFAPAIMSRLHNRFLHNSRDFAQLGVAARHYLRKEAKTLRYASTFLGNALNVHPKRREAYISQLRAMLDHLGALNDFAVARTVVKRAIAGRSRLVADAAGMELDQMARLEGEALKLTKFSVKSYRECKAFWSRQAKDCNLSQP